MQNAREAPVLAECVQEAYAVLERVRDLVAYDVDGDNLSDAMEVCDAALAKIREQTR
jgi:hypothetical protein